MNRTDLPEHSQYYFSTLRAGYCHLKRRGEEANAAAALARYRAAELQCGVNPEPLASLHAGLGLSRVPGRKRKVKRPLPRPKKLRS